MQQKLYKSQFLIQAEEYHKKSVHANWDGKKAESQKYGRLCGDLLVKSLENDELEPEYKVSLYWRAVLLHHEVRRNKIAEKLAKDALEFIKIEGLEKQSSMFEAYLAQ